MREFFANHIRATYVLAMVLAVVFAIVAETLIWSGGMGQLDGQALRINIAGKQRALTEQVSLLSLEFMLARDAGTRDQARAELEASVIEYERFHNRLTAELGPLSETLEVMYFGAPDALDRTLRERIGYVRALLALPEEELVEDNPFYQLIQQGRAEVYAKIDRLVLQYQLEQEEMIRGHNALMLWINGGVIFILAFTALAIFSPMAKLIRLEKRGLQAANRALDSVQLQERAHRQQLDSLFQLAEQMLWVRSQHKLMQSVADFLYGSLAVHGAAVFELSADDSRLVLHGFSGCAKPALGVDHIDAGPGSKGAMMLESKQPVFIADLAQADWLDNLSGAPEPISGQAVAVALHGQAETFGLLLVVADPGYSFGTEETRYIQSLGNLLGIACESIQMDLNLHAVQRDLLKGTRISALGELGTSLAHELNQPLVAIMNYAHACKRMMDSVPDESIKSNANGSYQVGALLEKLVAEAERAGAIIKHMRDYLETGELHETMLDLNSLVRDSVELARTEAEANGLDIEFVLDPDLPRASADKIQLQQVMFNLLRNAIAGSRESEHRFIRVATRKLDNDMVEVILEDSGNGGYCNMLEGKGYVPFAAKQGKMGVGLSVCKSIIDAHGGQIWATRAMPPMTTSSSVHFTLHN